MKLQVIQQKIFEIRDQKVMLDFDLAELYQVETKRLKESVGRNKQRFPIDFMFQLTKGEFDTLRTQIATSNRGGTRYMPFAFTEHGVAMLSGILNSDKAINMNIAIMRAFITLKKFAIQYDGLLEQLDELRERIGGHDEQLNQIYTALENVLDKKVEEEIQQQEWKNRKRIGFKN